SATGGGDGEGQRHEHKVNNTRGEEEGEEEDEDDDDDDDDDEDEEHEYLMVRSGTPVVGGDGGGVVESKEEGSQAEGKGDEGGHERSAAGVSSAARDALKRDDRHVGATAGRGEATPEIGLGEYLLKVVYIKGATMRDGVEIDNAAVVGNLPFETTAIATNRTICSCGIPRFKTQRGWISEWLRGGMEELVVEVLHHKPRKPIKYQVICDGGAMVRETANISGPEARGSGCKKGTVVGVAERLRLSDGTMRLRVVEPAENMGWISEKDHIVQQEPRQVSEAQQILTAEAKRRQAVLDKRKERSRRDTQAAERHEGLKAAGRLVEVEVTGTFEASARCLFLFDRARTTIGVSLSSDLGTAACSSSGNRGMVLGSRGFRGGVHYWEVKLDRCNWGSVFLGVAPRHANAWHGYGFLNYRACQSYGTETLYGAYYAAGDRVGVLLDMDRGTVSFVKDGDDFNMGRPVVVNMGIAYHHLRRVGRNDASGRNGLAMYPCFGVKAPGDQMTVRGQKWLSRRGLGHARRVRQAVDAIVAARELKRSFIVGAPPPVSLVEGARRRYKNWRRGRFSAYPSRAGVSCEVDVTAAALRRAE
ncbi:unnamed protein product, partial [Laminaria digitata]